MQHRSQAPAPRPLPLNWRLPVSTPSCLLAALPTLLTCLLLYTHRPGHAGPRGRRDPEDGAAVVKPDVHRMESTVLLYPDTCPPCCAGKCPRGHGQAPRGTLAPREPCRPQRQGWIAAARAWGPGGVRGGHTGSQHSKKGRLWGAAQKHVLSCSCRDWPPIHLSRSGHVQGFLLSGGSCRPENTALLAEAAKYTTVHPA